MKKEKEAMISDEFEKHGRPKTREVSSRYLTPVSTPSSVEPAILLLNPSSSPSPSPSPSPTQRKSTLGSSETRKHPTQEASALNHGLRPSAMTSSSNKKYDTLAVHLGIDRSKDVQKPRRASSNEFIRIEEENGSSKENHRPIVGRSMRYTSKSHNLGKSTTSSSSKLQSLTVNDNAESEANCSDCLSQTDLGSPFSGQISTASIRRAGIEVSSKYMNDKTKRTQRRSSDPSFQRPASFESSTKLKNSMIKSVIKRTNSMSGYGSSTSQWALSPGRSDLPPMSVENMEKPMSFSSSKLVDDNPKAKGMEKLLNFGLDSFKSKKISSSPTGSTVSESFHQFRLLHNRMLQWRFANARADSANKKISTSTEINAVSAWDAVSNLQRSFLLKKLQTEKEKMEMKMILILLSQLKPLESWGEMERQHLTALSMTKQCLHSVVCRIPLVEGAQMETQSTAMELRRSSDLSGLIKLMMNLLSPSAQKTAALLSELTKVIGEEKLVLEECFTLCRIISTLQIRETSLKSGVIQLFPQLQFEEQKNIG